MGMLAITCLIHMVGTVKIVGTNLKGSVLNRIFYAWRSHLCSLYTSRYTTIPVRGMSRLRDTLNCATCVMAAQGRRCRSWTSRSGHMV